MNTNYKPAKLVNLCRFFVFCGFKFILLTRTSWNQTGKVLPVPYGTINRTL